MYVIHHSHFCFHIVYLFVVLNNEYFLGLVLWTCFGALAMTKQWHCLSHASRTLLSLHV